MDQEDINKYKSFIYHEDPFISASALQVENNQNLCIQEMEKFIDGPFNDYYEGLKTFGIVSQDNEIQFNMDRCSHFFKNYLHQVYKIHYQYQTGLTWCIYWVVDSLVLLGESFSEYYAPIIEQIKQSMSSGGMFSPVPHSIPHAGCNYAAIMTLLDIGTDEAYNVIDRKSLYKSFLQIKNNDGSFRNHVDGETDIRALYCVVCVCSILNMLTPQLMENTVEYILKCQSYEGGFGTEPDNEAHAGYTYCAVASLCLLESLEKCDVDLLEEWSVVMQCNVCGGFAGRTNKLPDVCYSHWCGSVTLMTELYKKNYFNKYIWNDIPSIFPLFSQNDLERYILFCCQTRSGGIRDKPKEVPDLYHTHSALSGLSYCQNYYANTAFNVRIRDNDHMLLPQHPIYTIPISKVNKAKLFFAPISHDELME